MTQNGRTLLGAALFAVLFPAVPGWVEDWYFMTPRGAWTPLIVGLIVLAVWGIVGAVFAKKLPRGAGLALFVGVPAAMALLQTFVAGIHRQFARIYLLPVLWVVDTCLRRWPWIGERFWRYSLLAAALMAGAWLLAMWLMAIIRTALRDKRIESMPERI